MIQTSQLRGLEGNFQAQPRVFAHDAKLIVIGAIDYSDANQGIKITNFGTGYAPGDFIDLSAGSGSIIASIKVLTISGGSATGPVDTFEYRSFGKGYVVGNQLTQTNAVGGQNFTCNVTSVNIPNTQERGCCLYVGDVDTNGANVEVVMEGSNGTDTVVFKNLTSGSFLPILIKRIVPTNTNAGEFIALY